MTVENILNRLGVTPSGTPRYFLTLTRSNLMVNLTKIADNLEAIPSNQREAIINLIDIKVENDMEKVLQKLDSMETKFDAKIDALDAKFSNKFKSLYWVLAVSGGFIVSFTTLTFTIATFVFK